TDNTQIESIIIVGRGALPYFAQGSRMIDNHTAGDVRILLRLEPHPTCGFVRETFRSAQSIAPGGLAEPFGDGRPLGSALYFMVTPSAAVKLHRIRNDQLYHYYLGDPEAHEALIAYTPAHCDDHPTADRVKFGRLLA